MNDKPTYEELENKVKELECELAKLKLIINYSERWVGFRNAEGKLVYSSPAFEDITGYSNQDFYEGKITMKDYIHPDDYEMVFEKFKTGMQGGKLQPFEYRIITKNKEIKHVSLLANPIWQNDVFLGLRAAIKDITEQKETQQALIEIEKKYKSLVNDIPAAIILIKDGKRVDCNKYYLKKFGLKNFEEFISKPASFFVPEFQANGKPSAEEFVRHLEIVKKNGIDTFEWLSKNISGDILTFEIQLSTFTLNNELYILCIGWDISDRKEIEQTLHENAIELKKLNSEKDKFIRILAHDLKNPFNSLLGFSDILSENLNNFDKEKTERYIHLLNQSLHNTYDLLEDLLLWSKSQTKNLQFTPQLLNVNDVFSGKIEHLKAHAHMKNITIKFHEADNIEMFADVNMIKIILRNLILNAVKFTHSNGAINIYAEKKDPFALITISDNGIGIDKKDIPKIWEITEKYTSVGTDGEKGTGLGLALCKEFIEKHGGRIWVESELGKGSDFKFTIPMRDIREMNGEKKYLNHNKF